MSPSLLTAHLHPFNLLDPAQKHIHFPTINPWRRHESVTFTMKTLGQSLFSLALIAVQLSPLTQGAVVSRQPAHTKRSFLNPATESKSYLGFQKLLDRQN